MKIHLKPGDTVRVVGERGTAKIRSILTTVGNAVLLEKAIGGFRNWNIGEIRLVKRVQSTIRPLSDAHRAKLTANWRRTKTK